MREVNRIDSVGVGTLSMILKRTMASETQLLLVASDAVRSVLATSSLDKIFKFADSTDEALSS